MTEPSLKEKAARLARFRSCPVGSVASLYPHQINGGWSAFADDIEAVLADREALKAQLEEAEGALERQADNMAFILNHVGVPQPWYDKFSRELAVDRLYRGSKE